MALSRRSIGSAVAVGAILGLVLVACDRPSAPLPDVSQRGRFTVEAINIRGLNGDGPTLYLVTDTKTGAEVLVGFAGEGVLLPREVR